MWKRLQQSKTARQATIGDPLLVDTTLDENAYGLAQNNLREIDRSSPDGSMRPSRPPRPQDGQPQLVFKPLRSHPYTSPANERPPSSIYTPNVPQSRFPQSVAMAAKVYGEEVEISPPSSPDTETPSFARRFQHDDVDVSPVDEMPEASILRLGRSEPASNPRPAGSSIPILRRERRRNNLNAKKEMGERGKATQSSTDTRWDTLTGEPTTSDRGRPPQVRPGEFVPPGSLQDSDGGGGMALQSTAPAPKAQASFGERVRKLKESNAMPGNRPEWRGSSGRTTIVAPVADQLDIPPLSIPRKSSKRTGSPRLAEWGHRGGSGASSAPTSAIQAGLHETPSVSGYPSAGTMIRAAAPLQGRDSADALTTSTPFALHAPSYTTPTFRDSLSPDNYTTKPLPLPDQNHPPAAADGRGTLQRRDDSTSTIEQNFREALKDLNIPTPMKDQPVSRFSVTTYATTAADSTPRASIDEPPPMPSPPTRASPLVNRSRPRVGGSIDASKATARKAVPSSPVTLSMSSTAESRRNSKMLPKSPPEAASVDLVSSLQAQLGNLAHRRRNLERSIHQMTELMPADPMARGMEALRQAEERRKVDMLKDDLAEVIREEHDLGLRLHRAYKRMDQDAVYESTTLWVRRVTS